MPFIRVKFNELRHVQSTHGDMMKRRETWKVIR